MVLIFTSNQIIVQIKGKLMKTLNLKMLNSH